MLIVLISLVGAGLTAAHAANASTIWTLTVSLTGSGSGRVVSSPAGIDCPSACSAPFADGSGVTLTATPDSRSSFGNWQYNAPRGCLGEDDQPCTLLMNRNIAGDASFVSTQVTVGVGGTGSGTVTSSPTGIDCATTCAAKFVPGSDVFLHAAPDSRSAFSGWSGGCSGVTLTCDLVLNADLWTKATFTKLPPPYPSRAVPLARRTKTSGCNLRRGLPDRGCTPGAIYTDVGQVQLCTPAYAAKISVRPIPDKSAVFRDYGIPPAKRGRYAIDHLVPLDLGGSNTIANLWPQSLPASNAKNRLERTLYRQVCTGQIGLRTAQRAIASNWIVLDKHV
jgi:hypothetical protein